MHPFKKASLVVGVVALVTWIVIIYTLFQMVGARIEIYYLLGVYVVFNIMSQAFYQAAPKEE